MGDLAWEKVYDYILETENCTNVADFYRKAMNGIGMLVPFDAACTVQCDLGGPGSRRCTQRISIPEIECLFGTLPSIRLF
jgi:hypothetical protein